LLVTPRHTDEKFLRAAIRIGLRLQRNSEKPQAGGKHEHVATLQRIKASLRKRNHNPGTIQ
jgi:hypothetical protein